MNISQYKLSQRSVGDNQDLFHICVVDSVFCSNPSPYYYYYFFFHICNHLSWIAKAKKTSSQSVYNLLSIVANRSRPTDKQKETHTNKQHS